ncbi:Shugoshin-1 [Quillaja saponaria]|uniref:Shugoshin-1 n=1 Tax=Quillaja saponaria TaxID=32244 RepID=A0AAD7M5N7_QUISA|nr:Shugoshin-1 [Quillaja saponaria]
MAKGNSVGGAQRKKLADITNLQQQPLKFSNEQAKKQYAPAMSKDYIDQLHKENMTLMKSLADRHTIIELSVVEIQKLRTNLEKLKKQNWQLAQANNQMLADLNANKERLRELQHELGCKNGMLKAMKLESEGKRKTMKLPCEIVPNKVGRIENEQGAETSQADIGDDKLCNTEKWRLSKPQSLGSNNCEKVHAMEKVDNKRRCLRRQSARFKSEKLEPNEDNYEIDDHENDNCPKLSEETFQENNEEGNTAPNIEPQKIQRSSIGNTLHRIAGNVLDKEKVDNKRPRRKSARLNSEILEPTKNLSVIDDTYTKYHVSHLHDELAHSNFLTSSGATLQQEDENEKSCPKFESQKVKRSFEGKPLGRAAENVHVKEKVVHKRCSLRRQSTRLKSEKLEPTENLFLIDASKVPLPCLHDDPVHESCLKLEAPVQEENDGGNSAPKYEPQEIRKSYAGRPVRQAAEKVQSYKENSLKMKIRRPVCKL